MPSSLHNTCFLLDPPLWRLPTPPSHFSVRCYDQLHSSDPVPTSPHHMCIFNKLLVASQSQAIYNLRLTHIPKIWLWFMSSFTCFYLQTNHHPALASTEAISSCLSIWDSPASEREARCLGFRCCEQGCPSDIAHALFHSCLHC